VSDTPILASALKQLDADLAQLPPEVTKQLVVAADVKGMTIGWAMRTHNGWKLSAEVEQRWAKQRPEARVTLSKQWT
jgi:hypothetical protein